MIEPWDDMHSIGSVCHDGNAYAVHLADELRDLSDVELAARRLKWAMDAAEFEARRAVIAAAQMMVPPSPAVKMPTRFIMRYGVVFCLECGLAAAYCKGHAAPDPPAKDGAESNLAKRIAEAKR